MTRAEKKKRNDHIFKLADAAVGTTRIATVISAIYGRISVQSVDNILRRQEQATGHIFRNRKKAGNNPCSCF